jgi:hypothetical protein
MITQADVLKFIFKKDIDRNSAQPLKKIAFYK